MTGGKDPRLSSRSGKHLESHAYFATVGGEMGAIGFDPTQGGEMPWSQPGISPRDPRSSCNVPTAPQGQSQVCALSSRLFPNVTSGHPLAWLPRCPILSLFSLPFSSTRDLDTRTPARWIDNSL